MTAQKISLNAAELGSQMKSLNKRWSNNVKWGAKLNMHIMYIIISGNPDIAASKHNTMHWTNLWNQLFTADDNKCLTVKWLEPPEDQALQPTMTLVHNSDDLMLHVTDWEGKVAKKKPSAKDGCVPSEQGGTSGDPNPDDGADGTTRPNPKRRRKNEVADGSGTRRGAKRKKVISNLIIEDEDEGPQATSTHSIGPALSSTSTPPSPLPVFGVGTMGPPMADVDVTSVVSSTYHSTFKFMPMDINDFPTSNVDVDFLQFPGLDIFENQDLLGTPAGLL
ncbi:hypothetical protein BS47DRAFT_1365742 [Hydnum rufescens UP504]|uniref:Uncharacterized protein n=1 Tax=Hydnum rufescens UP504 TaxID=1448309 RepID=A0A9P6DRS2_9AGAM|nr:hypothetical protein BS47DRAFT_1365742 [Hydnum rufescens UP504]